MLLKLYVGEDRNLNVCWWSILVSTVRWFGEKFWFEMNYSGARIENGIKRNFGFIEIRNKKLFHLYFPKIRWKFSLCETRNKKRFRTCDTSSTALSRKTHWVRLRCNHVITTHWNENMVILQQCIFTCSSWSNHIRYMYMIYRKFYP